MSEESAEEPSPPSSSSSSSASPDPDSPMSNDSPQSFEDTYTMPQEDLLMPNQGPPIPEQNMPVADPVISTVVPSTSYEPDISISEQIDFMLGEFEEGPEPFHPVPEEFQPMLDQLQNVSDVKEHTLPEPFHVVPDCTQPQYNSLQYFHLSAQYSESRMCDMVSNDFQEITHTYVPITNGEQQAVPGQDNLNQSGGKAYNTINELCHVIGEEEQSLTLGASIYPAVQQAPMPMPYEEFPNPYLPGPSYQHDISMVDQMSQLPQTTQMQQMPQMPHMSQMQQMAQMSQMSQVPQMAAMPQMLQVGQMAPMPQMGPISQMAQIEQMQQMPQMAMEPQVLQPTPTLRQLLSPPKMNEPVNQLLPVPHQAEPNAIKGDSPRELRNRAEKQRRDKLNQSISLLATIVPPVVAMPRKIDKTTIMRLTAHYLRSHQYVFGDAIEDGHPFKSSSTHALLSLIKGFVLTITYRGIVVVVSPNIRQFLGYSELDLIGTNVYAIVHDDDHKTLREQLMPRTCMLGKYGELLIPDEPDGKRNIALTLAKERRSFVLRFKRLGHRSEPAKYVTCHVEGSLRKSDRACRVYNRCCHIVRRARARGENPRSSGNDIVFVGVVRPTTESFFSEGIMESFRMEYRTRHSVDGEIIQCEQRIALVTGYMTQEVSGINAMNFMHRDDVRWVVIALREMYDQHRLFGESCYRLMTKNGEFVYMRTRGRLDVDESSKIAKSFVCTNTVVGEDEGKYFIDQMKKRFTILVNNCADSLLAVDPEREGNESYDENSIPVEDPRQLEKVILHLVTNLPSPESSEFGDNASSASGDGSQRISIIAPKKERIVSAIKNIENVLHPQKRIRDMKNKKDHDNMDKRNNIHQPRAAQDMSETPIGYNTMTPSSSNGRQIPISAYNPYTQVSQMRTSQLYNQPPPRPHALAVIAPTPSSTHRVPATPFVDQRYIIHQPTSQTPAYYTYATDVNVYHVPTSAHVNERPVTQVQINQGLIGSEAMTVHPQNLQAFGMPASTAQAFYMLQSNITAYEQPQQIHCYGNEIDHSTVRSDGIELPSTSRHNFSLLRVNGQGHETQPDPITQSASDSSRPQNIPSTATNIEVSSSDVSNEQQETDQGIDDPNAICSRTGLLLKLNLEEEKRVSSGASDLGSISWHSSDTGSTSISLENSDDFDMEAYLHQQEEPAPSDFENELMALDDDGALLDSNFDAALVTRIDPTFPEGLIPDDFEKIEDDAQTAIDTLKRNNGPGPRILEYQIPDELARFEVVKEVTTVFSFQNKSNGQKTTGYQIPDESSRFGTVKGATTDARNKLNGSRASSIPQEYRRFEAIEGASTAPDTRKRLSGPGTTSVTYQPHYFNETLLTDSDDSSYESRKRPRQEDREETEARNADSNNNQSENVQPREKPYKGKGRGKRSR